MNSALSMEETFYSLENYVIERLLIWKYVHDVMSLSEKEPAIKPYYNTILFSKICAQWENCLER